MRMDGKHTTIIKFSLLQCLLHLSITIQLSQGQLREHCRGVETEDEFSKARLSGCSRGSVTVKFNFKYIRLEKIMGIRAELICDNGRTIPLYDYKKLDDLRNKQQDHPFSIDTSVTGNCTLLSCYYYKKENGNEHSYNLSTDHSECTFPQLQGPTVILNATTTLTRTSSVRNVHSSEWSSGNRYITSTMSLTTQQSSQSIHAHTISSIKPLSSKEIIIKTYSEIKIEETSNYFSISQPLKSPIQSFLTKSSIHSGHMPPSVAASTDSIPNTSQKTIGTTQTIVLTVVAVSFIAIVIAFSIAVSLIYTLKCCSIKLTLGKQVQNQDDSIPYFLDKQVPLTNLTSSPSLITIVSPLTLNASDLNRCSSAQELHRKEANHQLLVINGPASPAHDPHRNSTSLDSLLYISTSSSHSLTSDEQEATRSLNSEQIFNSKNYDGFSYIYFHSDHI